MQFFINKFSSDRWARYSALVGLMLTFISAYAQTHIDIKKPLWIDPANADVPIVAVVYQSSFIGYRPLSDESLADWKNSNAQFVRIGIGQVDASEYRQADTPNAIPVLVLAKDRTGYHRGQP